MDVFNATEMYPEKRKGPPKTVRTPENMELDHCVNSDRYVTKRSNNSSYPLSKKGIGEVIWPTCSPDLSPSDYFLWAYLMSLVYKDRSKTLDDLMNHIRTEIDNIPGRYA
ncbi:hypothetical protein TNCV_310191 [Trichonephila clavipes]|nr:hypothetical protein TNCV_310191 [Trichonephila clavipes]